MYYKKYIPPIVYPTLAYIAGIAVYGTVFSYYLPFALGAIALVTCALYNHAPLKSSFLIMIIALAAGALSIHVQQQAFAYDTYLLPTARCDIKARITDALYTPLKTFPFRFTLAVQSIRKRTKKPDESAWQNTSITMHLFCRKESNLKPGMLICLENIALTPIKNKELGLFAMKEGIVCSSFISTAQYCVLADKSESWRYKKYDLLEKIKQQLSPDCFWLFSSIFLGNKTEIHEDQAQTKDFFNRWGITHHLARSGLHLVIIILVWQLLARILPVHFFIKQLLFICLSLMYLHLSWASIPFYRALWTFILHRACLFMRIRPYSMHIICLVCLLCLLKNPVQLFFLDFQLSFALTFTLIALGHIETTQTSRRKDFLAQGD